MKLTRSFLRKFIREEMQKENIQTWFTEQPADVLNQVVAALEPMTGPMTHNKPLMTILQKAEEADLTALLDQLQNPYGKGAKSFKASFEEGEATE